MSQKIDYKVIDNREFINVLTVVLYKHKDLDKFRRLSGELTHFNEYQCHYFALVRKEKNDNVEVNYVFPLVFYNYEQSVSGATVDFDMEKVTDRAKELGELALNKFKLLKLQLIDIPSRLSNAEVSYSLTFYNNIHKHP